MTSRNARDAIYRDKLQSDEKISTTSPLLARQRFSVAKEPPLATEPWDLKMTGGNFQKANTCARGRPRAKSSSDLGPRLIARGVTDD